MSTTATQPVLSQAPELRPFYVGPGHRQQELAKKSASDKIPNTGPNIEVAKRGKSVDGLMRKIETFFSKPEHMGKLLPFLKGESKISLRLIEWFVSIYTSTEEHSVEWFLENGEFFNVYLDYRAMMGEGQVGGYTKQLFDPFCRKWRKEKRKDRNDKTYTVKIYHGIKFYYTDDEYEITTVAQLNFFKWFIGNKVLDYMIEHKDELTAEMNRYNHDKKRHRKEAAANRKAARELTPQRYEDSEDEDDADVAVPLVRASRSSAGRKVRVQAMKRVTKRNVEVYVSFD